MSCETFSKDFWKSWAQKIGNYFLLVLQYSHVFPVLLFYQGHLFVVYQFELCTIKHYVLYIAI